MHILVQYENLDILTFHDINVLKLGLFKCYSLNCTSLFHLKLLYINKF